MNPKLKILFALFITAFVQPLLSDNIQRLPSADRNRQLFNIEQTFPARDANINFVEQDVMRRRIHLSEKASFKVVSVKYECTAADGGINLIDPKDYYHNDKSQWWVMPEDVKLLDDTGEEVNTINNDTGWVADIQSSVSVNDVKLRVNLFSDDEPFAGFPIREAGGFTGSLDGMKTVRWESFVDDVGEWDTRDWARLGFFKIGLIVRASEDMKNENGDNLGKKIVIWEDDLGDEGYTTELADHPQKNIIEFDGDRDDTTSGELPVTAGSFQHGCSWEPIAAWSNVDYLNSDELPGEIPIEVSLDMVASPYQISFDYHIPGEIRAYLGKDFTWGLRKSALGQYGVGLATDYAMSMLPPQVGAGVSFVMTVYDLLVADGLIEDIAPQEDGISSAAMLSAAIMISRPENPAQVAIVETLELEKEDATFVDVVADAEDGVRTQSYVLVDYNNELLLEGEYSLTRSDSFSGDVLNSEGDGGNRVIYGAAGMQYAGFGTWGWWSRVGYSLKIPPLKITQSITQLTFER